MTFNLKIKRTKKGLKINIKSTIGSELASAYGELRPSKQIDKYSFFDPGFESTDNDVDLCILPFLVENEAEFILPIPRTEEQIKDALNQIKQIINDAI